MKGFGILLIVFGVISIVLSFMDMNLRILMWIDEWGETTGWAIRIGLIAVGAVLAAVGIAAEKKSGG